MKKVTNHSRQKVTYIDIIDPVRWREKCIPAMAALIEEAEQIEASKKANSVSKKGE